MRWRIHFVCVSAIDCQLGLCGSLARPERDTRGTGAFVTYARNTLPKGQGMSKPQAKNAFDLSSCITNGDEGLFALARIGTVI